MILARLLSPMKIKKEETWFKRESKIISRSKNCDNDNNKCRYIINKFRKKNRLRLTLIKHRWIWKRKNKKKKEEEGNNKTPLYSTSPTTASFTMYFESVKVFCTSPRATHRCSNTRLPSPPLLLSPCSL